jgi:hypothetical protein
MTTPSGVFQEANGLVVMEAENATWNLRRGSKVWLEQSNLSGYAGEGYLTAFADTGLLVEPTAVITSSELQFTVNFTTTGVYTLWLRGYAPDGAGDSLYLGLANQGAVTPTILTGFVPQQWHWSKIETSNGVAILDITQPGLHTLHLWQREDGLRLDRLLLTTDSGYTPPEMARPKASK